MTCNKDKVHVIHQDCLDAFYVYLSKESEKLDSSYDRAYYLGLVHALGYLGLIDYSESEKLSSI